MTLMATKKCPKCQEEKLIVEFASPICAPCCKPDVDAELELCRYRVKIALLEEALKKADAVVAELEEYDPQDNESSGPYLEAKKKAEAYQVMK